MAIRKTNEELIRQFVARRKTWEEIYSPSYVFRFFSLYDGEMEALIDLARKHVAGPTPFLGEGI